MTNANAASSQGSIGLGKGIVKVDGSVELNGKRFGGANVTGACPPEPDALDDDELDDIPLKKPSKTRKTNEK